MQQNPLNELVFIDNGVADADLLAASIPIGKQVFWLNSASDPWQQITQALSDHNNVSAIHIISHGNNGQINLGGNNFDADALAARSELLSSWQSYLADGADILLYGCNIGNGETGSDFINALSNLTGTNVAASTDMTGSINFGGDWDLEIATGTIETEPLALAASGWEGALPTSTVYNANYQQLVFDNLTVVSGARGQDGSVVRYDNVITVNGQAIDAVMSVALSSGTTMSASEFDPSNAGVSPDNFELSNLQVGSNNGYGTFTIAFYLHGTNTAVTLQNVAINSYDIDGNQFQEFRGFASYEVGDSGNTILTSTVQSDGSVRFQSNSTGNSVLTADQARVKVYYDSISTFQLRAGFGNSDNGPAFFSLDFSQGNPWAGAYSTINTPAPKVTYSATTFTEAGANNGSITGSSTITLTGGIGAAETFIPDGSGGVQGVNITNVPAGLTAVLAYVDSTHATLSFTGTAANHANIDDINNVTVSFGNTSFSSGDASFVTGATRADLIIDYSSPIPSIVAATASVTEGADLVYTVTIDSSGSTRTVPLTLTGTATTQDYSTLSFTNGVTYDSNTGMITIPGGVTTFDVTIPTVDDNIGELTETVILTIDGIVANTGSIVDNDPITTTVSSVTVSEASPYAVVKVSLSKPSDSATTFTPSLVSGAATVGSDTGSSLQYYNGSTWASAGSGVTITAGNTEVLLRVAITNDSNFESSEDFQISTGTLTGNHVTSTAATGTVTIVDNGSSSNVFLVGNTTDVPTSGTVDNDGPLSVTSPSVSESSPYAVFTVTGTVGRVISLALADASAIGTGSDYGSATPSNLQYSLDNGSTWLDYSAAITFTGTTVLVRTPLTNDTVYEGSETFSLTVTPSIGLVVTGTATINDNGTGTIFNADGSVNSSGIPDNDTPVVSIVPVTVSESSPYAVVQVSLSHASTSAISFTPTLVSSTGTVGADSGSSLEYFNGSAWVSAASGVSIAAGNTGVLLRTTISNDDIYEGLEAITVSTGVVTGTAVSSAAVNGVITIADDGSSNNVFLADTNSATPVIMGGSTSDNDTPVLSVTSVTVSEASPYAVVQVSLSHASTSAISFTPTLVSSTGTVGADSGSSLEYFNGSAWVSAASGVSIAAGNTGVLLRTTISNDDIYEGLEAITVSTGVVTGTAVSSAAVNGVITIADDGSSSNVFLADTNSAVPVSGTANNDQKSNDNDGIPESTETALAEIAGGSNDLNNDGVADALQPAVATLAWINNTNFQNAIGGQLGSVPANSIVNLSMVNNDGSVVANAQVQNIQVISPASLPSPKPNNVSFAWDPISFAIAPITSEAPLIDADSQRVGNQQKVLIDISNAGLDAGTFNRYMKYISADSITSYVNAGNPLTDFNGNQLTRADQAGWYDFTARTANSDGARYITENGKITAIEITYTDGAFGDGVMANSQFSDFAMPVYIEPQTLASDTSMILADGIDNLLLNNISKWAVPHTATCLPDWMAKMAGNAKQPVKSVANLNGTGNSWDNELTGNNGNNKLSGLDGNDTLQGMKGNDVLIGGSGADILYGGAGKDIFKYLLVSDSPNGIGEYDQIADFKRGADKIDLRAIDANINRNGNQAFKLVDAFDQQAGQVYYDTNTQFLLGDINGDGVADFAIEITGLLKINTADILL